MKARRAGAFGARAARAACLSFAAFACGASPSAPPAPPLLKAADASDSPEDPVYVSDLGRTLLSRCDRILIGEVRSASPIPGGPAVSRVEVERELLEIGDVPRTEGKTVAVVGAPGLLDPAEARVLVFLAKPERGGTVRPLLACSRESSPQFDDLVRLVEDTLAAAREPTLDGRRRATRAMWMRHLEQDRAFLRGEALREIRIRLARADPVLEESDAAAMERLAVKTRDRRLAEQLLELAARVRARRSLDAGVR